MHAEVGRREGLQQKKQSRNKVFIADSISGIRNGTTRKTLN